MLNINIIINSNSRRLKRLKTVFNYRMRPAKYCGPPAGVYRHSLSSISNIVPTLWGSTGLGYILFLVLVVGL